MGLDAVIFCDCVEQRRLRVPHPYPRLLYIRSNGSPEIRTKDSTKIEEHDKWMELPPCEHEEMMVDGDWLGNIGMIERAREALEHTLIPANINCPVLLGKVLYCGSHTGDYLTIPQVRRLEKELAQLRRLNFKDSGISVADVRLIKAVTKKLERFVKASLRINKPIAF